MCTSVVAEESGIRVTSSAAEMQLFPLLPALHDRLGDVGIEMVFLSKMMCLRRDKSCSPERVIAKIISTILVPVGFY